jgi:uncharacterized membrane-anchored protein YhcB (DUF1043 family)
VYSFSELLLAALASGTMGVVIGVAVTRYMNPQRKENQLLEDRLEKAEHTLSEYQHQVTEHFTQTASLVNNLTESYRDIHEHLASSALKLSNLDISQPVIIADARSTLAAQVASGQPIEPPKDYAPKESEGPGTLSEEYGLRDDEQDNEDSEAIVEPPLKAVNDDN